MMYPDLEREAKLYALTNANKKDASFSVRSLAQFITDEFKRIHTDILQEPNELIRSEYACRADLIEWGARWDSNKNRPYFEGHERDDVVIERKKFVQYFLSNKTLYYSVDSNNNWIMPIRREGEIYDEKVRVLISHDESTFKSGEVQSKRWIFPDTAPFFNKGRGRSFMVSYFIVLHAEDVFFELSDAEWNEACLEYPELTFQSSKLTFLINLQVGGVKYSSYVAIYFNN